MNSMVQFSIVLSHEISDSLEQDIRRLLQASYPQDADFWATVSHWGSPPDARALVWSGQGALIGHAGYGFRNIAVGGQAVRIAGIGAVATQPDHQGKGHGRLLLQCLHGHLQDTREADFMLLGCRDAVVPFYHKAGFAHSIRTVHCLNPDSEVWEDQTWNLMVRPIQVAHQVFPTQGVVNLQGFPW